MLLQDQGHQGAGERRMRGNAVADDDDLVRLPAGGASGRPIAQRSMVQVHVVVDAVARLGFPAQAWPATDVTPCRKRSRGPLANCSISATL